MSKTTLEVAPTIDIKTYPDGRSKEVYEAENYTVKFRTKRDNLPDQIIHIVPSRRGEGLEIFTTNGRLVIEPQASNHLYIAQSKKF